MQSMHASLHIKQSDCLIQLSVEKSVQIQNKTKNLNKRKIHSCHIAYERNGDKNFQEMLLHVCEHAAAEEAPARGTWQNKSYREKTFPLLLG